MGQMTLPGMDDPKVYLWVNICDLDAMHTLPGIGSPFLWMVQPALGDELLDQSVYDPQYVDQMYLLIRCTQERADALAGGLEVLSKRKLNRTARSKITQSLPGSKWRISTPAPLHSRAA